METEAPSGYSKVQPQPFTLTDANSDGSLDSNNDPGNDGYYLFTDSIVDNETWSLATTGAAGIIIMLLGAIAAIVASATMIARRKAASRA